MTNIQLMKTFLDEGQSPMLYIDRGYVQKVVEHIQRLELTLAHYEDALAKKEDVKEDLKIVHDELLAAVTKVNIAWADCRLCEGRDAARVTEKALIEARANLHREVGIIVDTLSKRVYPDNS